MPYDTNPSSQRFQPTTNNEKSLSLPTKIEWSAYEFEKREKSKRWFNVLIIITIVFFALAVFLKIYTFAVVVLSASLCFYIYAKKDPRLINFSISSRGISINDRLYPYIDLRSFWIFFDPPHSKELVIAHKKKIQPLVYLPLDKQNPTEIRSFLLKYLPEEEQDESIANIFSDLIGF